jgi:hypothetical protein
MAAPRPTISPKERITFNRRTQITTVGDNNVGSFNAMVFRAPAAGAKIRAAALNFNLTYATLKASTWTFDLVNKSSGATLSATTPGMSGESLTASGWKDIPIDNGNATLLGYAGLQLVCTASGAPSAFDNAPVAIEWEV